MIAVRKLYRCVCVHEWLERGVLCMCLLEPLVEVKFEVFSRVKVYAKVPND